MPYGDGTGPNGEGCRTGRKGGNIPSRRGSGRRSGPGGFGSNRSRPFRKPIRKGR